MQLRSTKRRSGSWFNLDLSNMAERVWESEITTVVTPIGQVELVNGQLSHIRSPRYFSDWVGEYGAAIVEGLDVKNVQLGHALWIVVNDDGNFFLGEGIEEYLTIDEIEECRKNAIDRVEWEKGIPGIPGGITEELNALHEIILTKPWTDKENHLSALQGYEGIKDHIQNLPEAQDLINTYRKHETLLRAKWSEFVKKEILKKD